MATSTTSAARTPVPHLRHWRGGRAALAIALIVITGAFVSLIGDWSRLLAAIGELARTPALALAFVATYAAAFLLRAAAWSTLLPAVSVRRSFGILHASLLANHLAPVKAGEVLRPYLAVKHGAGPSDAIATTVVARGLDVIVIIALSALLMPRLPATGIAGFGGLLLPIVTVGTAIAAVAWLRTKKGVPLGPARVRRFAERAGDSLAAISLQRILAATAITLPSWVLEAGVVFIAARALGADIAFSTAIAVTSFTLVFQMFHLTPGGIGVYEATMTAAFAAFGIAPSEGLTIAALAHGLKFAYSFTAGTAFSLPVMGDVLRRPPAKRLNWLGIVFLAAQLVPIAVFFVTRPPVSGLLLGEAILLLGVGSVVLGRQWAGAWRPLPASADGTDDPRPVVVVIPAYNEADAIATTLARIPRHGNTKVLVVDDGSTDGTGKVAQAAGADLVVRHEANRGLGAALRTALQRARDFDPKAVVYVDADGEYDPAEIGILLAPVLEGRADYVLGSRYLGVRTGQLASRALGNLVFTNILRFAAGRWISDGQTGYRAFSRRALDAAEIVHDYNYAQVLTLDLLRKRMRMAEVPINWRRRGSGQSFVKTDYLWRVPLGMLREMVSN